MKARLLIAVLVVLVPLLSVSALGSSRADAANVARPGANGLQASVHGTFNSAHGVLTGAGTFSGTMTVRNFFAQGHNLMAHVNVTGTLKDAAGKTKEVNNEAATVQISNIREGASSTAALASRQPFAVSNGLPAQAATCNILTLNIGAIHLNLLGLVIDLSPITLTITGQTGAGNLLGNLLCGIAGLLNGVSLSQLSQILLQDIVTLLNQALGL